MKETQGKPPFRPGPRLCLALVAAVYLLTLGVIDRGGFWVIDNSAKYLQMRAIIESGYRDYWIPIPGRGLDPELRLNPVPFPFARVVEGNVYPVFSPVFAVISSIPYRLLGMNGLYLLPFLCSLLTLLGVAKIAGSFLGHGGPAGGSPPDGGGLWPERSWLAMTGGPARLGSLSVLTAGLCTPLWFYSAVFWEHAIAVCLCTWAVWFHLSFLRGRRSVHLAIGSALCAVGVWFRDELYLFSLVLLLAQLLAFRREGLKTALRAIAVFSGASVAFLLPLWIFQWWAIGRPFGFHLESHTLLTPGIWMHLSQRPRVLYNLLLATHENLAASLAFAVPLLLAFAVRPRLSWPVFRIALPTLGLFAALGTLLTISGYSRPGGSILALDRSNSLFAGVPILALSLLRVRATPHGSNEPAGSRWLHFVSLAYAILYVLAAPGLGSRGLHWGNRFLLVLYPLLIITAASNVLLWLEGSRCEERGRSGPSRRSTLLRWGLALVAIVSFGAQCSSINLLARVTDFSNRLNDAVEARPEKVIMTDIFWLPEFLHREFYKREIFLVRSEAAANYFRARFQAAGGSQYLYLTARLNPPPVDPDLIVDDRGLNFYTVRGYRQAVISSR